MKELWFFTAHCPVGSVQPNEDKSTKQYSHLVKTFFGVCSQHQQPLSNLPSIVPLETSLALQMMLLQLTCTNTVETHRKRSQDAASRFPSMDRLPRPYQAPGSLRSGSRPILWDGATRLGQPAAPQPPAPPDPSRLAEDATPVFALCMVGWEFCL